MSEPQYSHYKSQSTNLRKNIINNEIFTNSLHNDQTQSISLIKDTIISIEYRLKTLQQQINFKMEREQCLTLLQRKSNTNHVKKCFQEIYAQIEADRSKQQKQIEKIQSQQKQKIKQLKKKLQDVNHNKVINLHQMSSPLLPNSKKNNMSIEKITNKISKVIVKPQELYLESNQTMFSMLIDQIKQLKQRDSIIQRLIESKHKKNVSLNNQVCRKLEFLQASIEQTIKYIDNWRDNVNSSSSMVQNNEGKKVKTKKHSNTTNFKSTGNIDKFDKQKQKVYSTVSNPNQAFQSIRIELLSKSVEALQRQLSTKINIKDLLPLIRQNLTPYDDSLGEIRQYVEQNFESTRKILANQSQINEEISNANKLAWWHLYQRQDNYLVFNRQIMNIIPQILLVDNVQGQNNNITLRVLNQGWYYIQVHAIEHNLVDSSSQNNDRSNVSQQIQMEVNQNARYSIVKEKVIMLTADSQLRFLADVQELFLKIQKL